MQGMLKIWLGKLETRSAKWHDVQKMLQKELYVWHLFLFFFCLERNIELCYKLDELQTATIERLINENDISNNYLVTLIVLAIFGK